MKKYKYKIAKYKNYIIEYGKSPIDKTFEFWFYNINYGVKEFIVGLDKYDQKVIKTFLNYLLKGGLEFYTENYKKEHED